MRFRKHKVRIAMRRRSVLIAGLFCAGAILAAGPAVAARRFNSTAPVFPIESRVASVMADKQNGPYAMNYADEAAQSLGVSGGRWNAFDTSDSSSGSSPFLPSLRGGVDSGGAMIRLQWR
jgi:hypothetical protein